MKTEGIFSRFQFILIFIYLFQERRLYIRKKRLNHLLSYDGSRILQQDRTTEIFSALPSRDSPRHEQVAPHLMPWQFSHRQIRNKGKRQLRKRQGTDCAFKNSVLCWTGRTFTQQATASSLVLLRGTTWGSSTCTEPEGTGCTAAWEWKQKPATSPLTCWAPGIFHSSKGGNATYFPSNHSA